MKKELLNLLITELRKNKNLMNLFIDSVDAFQFRHTTTSNYHYYLQSISNIENTCNCYIDFNGLIYDISKYIYNNDYVATKNTIIKALSYLFNN